jgi:hypothetical protein
MKENRYHEKRNNAGEIIPPVKVPAIIITLICFLIIAFWLLILISNLSKGYLIHVLDFTNPSLLGLAAL